jgi:hypothetical protein
MPLTKNTQRSKKELRLVRRRTSARAGTHVAAGRFSHNMSAKILMEFHFLAAKHFDCRAIIDRASGESYSVSA